MSSNSEVSHLQVRLRVARLLSYIGLALLCIRLWYLQCVYGGYYRDLSENNRIRTIRTEAPRGTIYDRDGRVLVRNRPSFEIAMMQEDTSDVDGSIQRLALMTNRDPVRLQTAFHARRGGRPFEPKVIMEDISRADLARVKVNTHSLPGIIVSTIPTRTYPNGQIAAQLFGYVREISKPQLEAMRDDNYQPGDIVGQSGLEKIYESQLRGHSGYIRVEVDARGTRRGELGIVDDKPGNDLYLTLDLDMQRVAEQALVGQRGAVVAVDPRNGEILVMASSPTFDANIFSGPMLQSEWDLLARDSKRPLMNRAIASAYPPGSTFKLMWAAAALAEGKITPETEFYCPGYFTFAGRRYHCHKKGGHGMVNLDRAVTVSCNAYFYQVGQVMTITRMTKYMKMFGIGQLTNIGLPGEESGTLPSNQWKLQRYGERWYPGDTLPVSIGQGYVIVTPLQLAMITATIANGGTLYKPLLVKKIVNPQTGEEQQNEHTVVRELPIKPEVFAKVREFASHVVNDPRGTGRRAILPGITVAGKTGTAQVGALGKETLHDRFKDHAWFVAFAPAEAPTIAMVVLVENSGHGGVFSAPIAREVMATYFRKQGLLKEDLPELAPESDVPPDEALPQTTEAAQRASLVQPDEIKEPFGTVASDPEVPSDSKRSGRE